MWLAIQLICFEYFQTSTSAAAAAEAAREGQEGIAVANEETDVGEEEEEDGSQHAAVGEPARAEATGETDTKKSESNIVKPWSCSRWEKLMLHKSYFYKYNLFKWLWLWPTSV